jgi:uncharacterized membrane protein YqjE
MDAGKEAGGKLGAYAYGQTGRPGERSIGDILKDTVSNVQDIIRSEVQLAKIETKEELKKVTTASVMFGTAAVFSLFGLGFCLLCAVYALSLVLPNWAAALIVGGALVIIGGILAAIGMERWKKIKLPQKTMFTVKEDVEWMRSQSKS